MHRIDFTANENVKISALCVIYPFCAICMYVPNNTFHALNMPKL